MLNKIIYGASEDKFKDSLNIRLEYVGKMSNQDIQVYDICNIK